MTLIPILQNGSEAQILQVIKILADFTLTEEDRAELRSILSAHPVESVRKRFENLEKTWAAR